MFIQGLDQAQGGDTLFHHIHLQVKIYEIPQLVIPVSLFFTEAANHALTPDGPLHLVQLDHPLHLGEQISEVVHSKLLTRLNCSCSSNLNLERILRFPIRIHIGGAGMVDPSK